MIQIQGHTIKGNTNVISLYTVEGNKIKSPSGMTITAEELFELHSKFSVVDPFEFQKMFALDLHKKIRETDQNTTVVLNMDTLDAGVGKTRIMKYLIELGRKENYVVVTGNRHCLDQLTNELSPESFNTDRTIYDSRKTNIYCKDQMLYNINTNGKIILFYNLNIIAQERILKSLMSTNECILAYDLTITTK